MTTIRRSYALALLVGVVVFSPASLSAEIVVAELGINGLACPFCAYGLEKKLEALDGVETVVVKMDPGLATVTFSEQESACVEDMEKAVKEAGMSVRYIRILAQGVLRKKDGRWVLDANESKHLFLVAENEELADILEEAEIPQDAKAENVALPVLFEGSVEREAVKEHAGHPYTLTPASYCLRPRTVALSVERMRGERSATRVHKLLGQKEGVYQSWVYLEKKEVHVLACGKVVEASSLVETLEKAGFEVEPIGEDEQAKEDQA